MKQGLAMTACQYQFPQAHTQTTAPPAEVCTKLHQQHASTTSDYKQTVKQVVKKFRQKGTSQGQIFH